MVRTAWNRELSRCRLAFSLYDATSGHTWLIMLIVHMRRDGTLRHFTRTAVLLPDIKAVEKWNEEHFSEAEHLEEVVLNQKVIMVDVQMPSDQSTLNVPLGTKILSERPTASPRMTNPAGTRPRTEYKEQIRYCFNARSRLP
ncbi:hypothetical protein BDZ45DRAFT_679657 [Acephala macrosclerotiorum]|nr:hypothetical protein BDZ45DRAFT_679657 [Acephala macrosclerotiorum]